MSDFNLSKSDRDSGLWMRLKKHMKAELDALRGQNDSFSLDEIKTAATRGRIAQLKELIGLDKEPEQ